MTRQQKFESDVFGVKRGTNRSVEPPNRTGEYAAKALGVGLIIVGVASLIWTFAFNDVGSSPAYALNSELIYRLELAVAATALLAAPALLIAHLLTGRLPRSVGRGGVSWSDDRPR
jgi:hypothetical protein